MKNLPKLKRQPNEVYNFFININIVLNIWRIRNCEYMGSLLLGTQLKLQNTLHLTMALIKSKLFPEKKTSTWYWKWRATATGLLFNILHLWKKIHICMFMFVNFPIISTRSFKRSSVHERVRKKVGQPSCFTIVNTFEWNFFQ